jgi:hypothetical protein
MERKHADLILEATEEGVFSIHQGLQIESLVQRGFVIGEEVEDLIEEVASCDCCMLCEKKCKGTKKAPVGSPRQRSFCSRMCGHRKKNTGSKTAKDRDSCINQSLRRWRCRCSK